MRETAANFPHWPSFKIQLSSTYYELDFFGLDLRCHQQVNSGGGPRSGLQASRPRTLPPSAGRPGNWPGVMGRQGGLGLAVVTGSLAVVAVSLVAMSSAATLCPQSSSLAIHGAAACAIPVRTVLTMGAAASWKWSGEGATLCQGRTLVYVVARWLEWGSLWVAYIRSWGLASQIPELSVPCGRIWGPSGWLIPGTRD